jgi:fatty acid desaturase
MFIYGQDIHLTHHLYPAVPHYNLPKLHRLLMEHNEEYASHVVECHGVLWNSKGKPTLLDCMETPTCEPAAETPPPAAEFPLRAHGLRRHSAEVENGWREHERSLAQS